MNVENLKKCKSDGYKLAIWGAGKNGVTFYNILKKINLIIDCFIDNDEQKWEISIIDDIICHAPNWLNRKEKTIVYICVAPNIYDIIHNQSKKIANIVNGSIDEILDDIIANYQKEYFEILEELPYIQSGEVFYRVCQIGNLEKENYVPLYVEGKESNNKIAVYTGVFGDYDKVLEPLFISDNLDYYYISDEKPSELKSYKWIDAHNIIPSDVVTPIKRNRYIKMHPHMIFPDYEYSIYIDGNVQIIGDVTPFICESELGIAAFAHPIRDDIYYEALTIKNVERVASDDVCRQMKKYMSEGMPAKYGLAEMRIIAREHNKQSCIDVMERWWEEFDNMAQRDQFSFMYSMWKNGKNMDDLVILGNNSRQCPLVKIYGHTKMSMNVVNEKGKLYD